MDGRGRFLDNIFIERLYECVYLHAFSGGREARQGIGDWVIFYNHRRPMPRIVARRPSGYIETGCRLAARACTRTSTRQRWQRSERDVKPGRQAQTVAYYQTCPMRGSTSMNAWASLG